MQVNIPNFFKNATFNFCTGEDFITDLTKIYYLRRMDTSVEIDAINIIDDMVPETDELIYISLTRIEDALNIFPPSDPTIITIIDNDGMTLSLFVQPWIIEHGELYNPWYSYILCNQIGHHFGYNKTGLILNWLDSFSFVTCCDTPYQI